MKPDFTELNGQIEKLLEALNLTPAEKVYVEDIGPLIAKYAMTEIAHAAQKGHKLRPIACAASIAYALKAVDTITKMAAEHRKGK